MLADKVRVNDSFSKEMDEKVKKSADAIGVSKSQFIAMTVAKAITQEERMLELVGDLLANAIQEEKGVE